MLSVEYAAVFDAVLLRLGLSVDLVHSIKKDPAFTACRQT